MAPGQVIGATESCVGLANVPTCAGWCTPTLNMYNRVASGPADTSFQPYAKSEGPFCFGGCSELCCSSSFPVSKMDEGTDPNKKLKLGDLGVITKQKPQGASTCHMIRPRVTGWVECVHVSHDASTCHRHGRYGARGLHRLGHVHAHLRRGG